MGIQDLQDQRDTLLARKKELNSQLDTLKVRTKQSKDATEQSEINEEISKSAAELANIKTALDGIEETLKDENAKLEAAKDAGLEAFNHNIEKSEFGEDYLTGLKSVKDFADVMLEASKSGQDIKQAWAGHLKTNAPTVTKGITNPEVLIPEPVINEIKDKFNFAAKDLTLATWHFGTDRWGSAFNSSEEVGLGDNRENKDTDKKTEQTVTFAARTIIAEFVYKYITLDRSLSRKNNSDVILKHIMMELPTRVAYAIERAMWVGDGLADTEPTKIKENIIIPIAKDTTDWVTPVEISELNGDTLGLLEEEIEERPNMLLVAKMHKKTYGILKRLREDGTKVYSTGSVTLGGYTFPTLDEIIISTGRYMPLLEASTPTSPAIIMVNMPAYEFVSPTNEVEFYSNFILSTNKDEFLAEQDVAGGLLTPLSAAKASLPAA